MCGPRGYTNGQEIIIICGDTITYMRAGGTMITGKYEHVINAIPQPMRKIAEALYEVTETENK